MSKKHQRTLKEWLDPVSNRLDEFVGNHKVAYKGIDAEVKRMLASYEAVSTNEDLLQKIAKQVTLTAMRAAQTAILEASPKKQAAAEGFAYDPTTVVTEAASCLTGDESDRQIIADARTALSEHFGHDPKIVSAIVGQLKRISGHRSYRSADAPNAETALISAYLLTTKK